MVGRGWPKGGGGGGAESSCDVSPVPTPARGARARGEERRRFQREWNEEDVGLLIEATGGAGKVCASRIPEVEILCPWRENFV